MSPPRLCQASHKSSTRLAQAHVKNYFKINTLFPVFLISIAFPFKALYVQKTHGLGCTEGTSR
jgi:hypothetical protein